MSKPKPIPDEYPRVTPYLHVQGAAEAIEFYKTVFGAGERGRMAGRDGTGVGHAELEIGDSMVMLSDEYPEMDAYAPGHFGGSPVSLHVYVEDVDAVYAAALAAGAKSLSEVTDQFYGDRSGTFEDPWGHKWHVSSHVEDVMPEEMERRAAAQAQG
ncbi:VOC family protein [Glycomyces algeriensis]|uniref:Glyoxalase n=1 Tax=Glycomyces algeriensis TaxID=256037 RepID=A0A9W6G8V4_9ACTN|nr:VOC family protein [Glycomyces algeriensis]MDA1364679.1 VOC family protein [Glycomyces algeriensis]MDR7350719.1 PhnB protein [Glycomyces algeriensis]GLI43430.1 glyoxalase [Glycomyces algeriensis]